MPGEPALTSWPGSRPGEAQTRAGCGWGRPSLPATEAVRRNSPRPWSGTGRARRCRRLPGAPIRRTGQFAAPPGFDAVATVEHGADHGGGRHALADGNGRGDVFGHIDNQPGPGAAGELVGDPSPAGPPEVGPGRAGDNGVAESIDRAEPAEIDAVVDALGNQAADPPQRVTVDPPGAGDGGADDLRRVGPRTRPGPQIAGRLREPGPCLGG